MSRPVPQSKEWSAWATLCCDLADALRESPHGGPRMRLLFSERMKVAEHLWDAGYRPTPEAISRVREQQKEWI